MKKRCKQYLYLFIVTVLCISGGMVRAQSTPITIKEAIDIALANNYALRADSLNILVAGYKNKHLAGQYLPQVNYGSKLNYNPAIPSQMLPGTIAGQPSKDYVPVQFGTRYDASTGIEVTQTIYRKDLLLQMRSAGLYQDIARTRHQLTREDLIYQVAGSFYSLQSNAELIRTTRKDYQNLQEILTVAKAQFEHGTLKRIDYESLQINVANKESQLDQLVTQYNEQLDFFKYLLGLPVTSPLSISDSIVSLSAPIEPDGKQLLNREDIHLYNQLITSKEVDIKVIRAEAKPSLNSYFRYNYQSQFGELGKAFDNDYWFKSATVGLSVSVSLFDGNRRRNRIHIAQTELQQLKWQTLQKQERAATELSTSLEKLNNNRRQHQTNAQNLALAEKVFASRKALYAEGVTTLIELLDAEKELTQARNLHIQSMINVQTGQLDVYKANGTLLTEFLKMI